jgi:hypothetical protein
MLTRIRILFIEIEKDFTGCSPLSQLRDRVEKEMSKPHKLKNEVYQLNVLKVIRKNSSPYDEDITEVFLVDRDPLMKAKIKNSNKIHYPFCHQRSI